MTDIPEDVMKAASGYMLVGDLHPSTFLIDTTRTMCADGA